MDIKVGILISNLFENQEKLTSIHSDFILVISSYNLLVLKHLFDNIEKFEPYNNLLEIVNNNRKYLIEKMRPYDFKPVVGPSLNVQLFEIPPHLNSKELEVAMFKNGVGALSAEEYYWDSSQPFNNKFRIALARETTYFKNATDKLISVLENYLELSDNNGLVQQSLLHEDKVQ